MVRKLKIIGTFMISLFIFSSLCAVYSAEVSDVSGFSAKDKLPALISDVLGLDLSKYSITEERYKPRFEYGGAVEVEYCGFTLVDSKGGEVSVMSEFYNGFPEWVLISPSTGSLYYAIKPPKDSVDKMKNILERYVTFAQKYDIDTLDVSLAFDLLNKAPTFLPANGSPANMSLGDMTLFIAQNGFGFGYTTNGVNIPNRSWNIDFTDKISFHDTFGLYSVCDVNVFSEEKEFTNFAFILAQKFCDDHLFYRMGEDGVEVEVRPDWSNMRTEVGFYVIPGQMYNNPINNELLEQGAGVSFSADRDALTLYPFWSAVFYFSYSVGNIYGVQVGVWGDTKEVAYCWEYGFLGDSQNPSNGLSSEQSNLYGNLLIIAVVALIVIVAIIAAVLFTKRKHK